MEQKDELRSRIDEGLTQAERGEGVDVEVFMQGLIDDLDAKLDQSLHPHPDRSASREYYLKAAGYQVARQMMSEFVDGFRVLGNTPGAGHKRKVGSIIVGFSSGRLETT